MQEKVARAYELVYWDYLTHINFPLQISTLLLLLLRIEETLATVGVVGHSQRRYRWKGSTRLCQDELMWAATWLYQATKDESYLKYVVDNAASWEE
uniref:uncharacterized protein LOC122592561 isoform X2 n=1 Tax=Erigeron canadensis TaxID=72917 RepID=UPI001CB9BE35|nr:uncharacterized protein LOC122592561 isoform X2 [Erigeron canadensis]